MTIASCPNCARDVMLPPNAARTGRARCPLCESEFDLSEIYSKLPPMLILLDASIAAPISASLSSPIEAEIREPVGAAVAGGGGSAFESMFSHSSDDNGEGDLELAKDGGDELDFAADEGAISSADGSTAAPAAKVAPRPKKKPKSAAGELVKVMIGGFVGIAAGWCIAYWALGMDIGNLSRFLPEAVKPAKFRKEKSAAPANTTADKRSDNPAPNDHPAPGGNENAENQNSSGEDSGDTPDTKKPATETPDAEKATAEKATTETPGPGAADAEKPSTEKLGGAEKPADDKPADDKPVNEIPGAGKPTDAPTEKPTEEPAEKPAEKPADAPEEKPAEKPAQEPAEKPAVDPTEPSDAEPKPVEPGIKDPAPEKPETDKPETDKTEVEKPATDKPVVDDPAAATSGLKIETPIAAEEVAKLLDANKDATTVLAPADAAAKAAFTRDKYNAYVKLCELANAMAHSKLPAEDASAAAVASLGTTIAADDADANVMGQLANAWLSKKRMNDGIALSAEIAAVETSGELSKITVELPSLGDKLKPMSIAIYCHADGSLKAGDSIVVVGSVVEKPKDQIAGYKGEDGRVVWGALVQKRAK